MNNKGLDRQSVLIIFLVWMAYMISYLGRSDYSACVLEIVKESGVTKATAGMVSSAFAICNAIGQILAGFILKKITPVKVIGAELFTVAMVNFLFPNTNSFLLMAILWGINGCMQSTLLCGTTQILCETLKEPYLSRGVVLLSTISAVGGVLNYVLSWAMIRYISWRAVFITIATLLFLLAVIWSLVMPKLLNKRQDLIPETVKTEKQISYGDTIQKTALKFQISFFSQLVRFGTIFVILGAFFIGLLREGVLLWIPSYMSEVFGMSSSLSIIVTMFVPFLQICGSLIGGMVGRKTRVLQFPAGIVFILSGTCQSLLLLAGDRSVAFTIVLFAINAMCMTAALTFLLSLFPIRFFKKSQVPVLVGITNFFVHAGDFVASPGIGWLSAVGGWGLAFSVMSVSAFAASGICMIGGVICRKEIKRKNGKGGL